MPRIRVGVDRQGKEGDELRKNTDMPAQFTVLPRKLIRLLADSNIEVSISHYAVSELIDKA